jgi:hypothetical protein
MTVSDLATILLREQSEALDDPDYFATVIAWINDACSDIAGSHDWRFLKRTFNIPTFPGQSEYSLQFNDIKDVRSIQNLSTREYIAYRDDIRIIHNSIDMTLPGEPVFWWFSKAVDDQQYIQFWRVPTTVVNLEVRTHRLNTELVSGSNMPFQAEFILLIKDRVRAYMLEDDKDYDGQDRKMQEYYRRLAELQGKEVKKNAAYRRFQRRDVSSRYTDLAQLPPDHFHWQG